MPWLSNAVLLVGGLIVLAIGGESLVRGAARLARILGVPILLVGLTVVAFGTSAPEAAVTVYAAAQGAADLAVGNVVGSNIANILLILGLAAVISPLAISPSVLRFDGPVMIFTALLFYGLSVLNRQIDRWNGALFVAGLVAYTYMAAVRSRREPHALPELTEPLSGLAGRWWHNAILVGVGICALVVGARFIVLGATGLAELMGVPGHILGLTVVAVGTSLPELATTVAAARQKHPDIALGNVVGSNIFNVLFVTGLAGVIRPLPVPDDIIRLDGPLMLVVCLVFYPLVYTGRRLTRGEGLLLLAGYAGYLAWAALRAAPAAGS